jgi:hypothetical protein
LKIKALISQKGVGVEVLGSLDEYSYTRLQRKTGITPPPQTENILDN